jgi:hypothetical protein
MTTVIVKATPLYKNENILCYEAYYWRVNYIPFLRKLINFIIVNLTCLVVRKDREYQQILYSNKNNTYYYSKQSEPLK